MRTRVHVIRGVSNAICVQSMELRFERRSTPLGCCYKLNAISFFMRKLNVRILRKALEMFAHYELCNSMSNEQESNK